MEKGNLYDAVIALLNCDAESARVAEAVQKQVDAKFAATDWAALEARIAEAVQKQESEWTAHAS